MSFSDDDDFSLFKTRDGRATGHANERTMLDVVGGKRTIRTQIRDNPDGSTTRLKTRGGFAEFVTTEPKKKAQNQKEDRSYTTSSPPPSTPSDGGSAQTGTCRTAGNGQDTRFRTQKFVTRLLS